MDQHWQSLDRSAMVAVRSSSLIYNSFGTNLINFLTYCASCSLFSGLQSHLTCTYVMHGVFIHILETCPSFSLLSLRQLLPNSAVWIPLVTSSCPLVSCSQHWDVRYYLTPCFWRSLLSSYTFTLWAAILY